MGDPNQSQIYSMFKAILKYIDEYYYKQNKIGLPSPDPAKYMDGTQKDHIE